MAGKITSSKGEERTSEKALTVLGRDIALLRVLVNPRGKQEKCEDIVKIKGPEWAMPQPLTVALRLFHVPELCHKLQCHGVFWAT